MEMNHKFSTVTLADGVESSLLSYIHQSNISPGDLLPKEEQIAEELQVSRLIVREGLSRLKGLGLVESRQRRGTVMKRPKAFVSLSKFAQAKLLNDDDCQDLMGIRVALELGMCDLIYAHRNEEKIAELRKLTGNADCCQYSFDDEIAFHDKLFSLCGNHMAQEFRKVLESAMRPMYVNLEQEEHETPSHLDICKVLAEGTSEEFYLMMKKHLAPYSLGMIR